MILAVIKRSNNKSRHKKKSHDLSVLFLIHNFSSLFCKLFIISVSVNSTSQLTTQTFVPVKQFLNSRFSVSQRICWLQRLDPLQIHYTSWKINIKVNASNTTIQHKSLFNHHLLSKVRIRRNCQFIFRDLWELKNRFTVP